jgi:hypothetical protein
VDILSWFRRRPRAADIPERNRIARAIAERRYDLAEEILRTLPEGSDLREIFALQLLSAQSRYEEAAAFYERGSRSLRAQDSARLRYIRALSALKRTNDLEKTIAAIFASRAEPEFLAVLLPFMWDFAPDTRAAAAKQILSARKTLPLDVTIACAQTLLDTGDTGQVQAVVAALQDTSARGKAEIALLKCNIALQNEDAAAATRHLSDAFDAFGLESVSLRDANAPLNPQNLIASSPAAAEALPKTSVFVSCFNAEKSIGPALASLQAQSHRDIEIIVVDDFSTDGSAQIIEGMAAKDPRIRFVRLPSNKGAYHARNTALSQATGTFVLAHDADDWAHPRKVEHLVRRLIANPDLIAVRAEWVRFAPARGVLHRNTYIRSDVSSLTFRREPALAKAGYFDCVRMGADSEYVYRLQRLFGESAIGDVEEMLSVASYTPNNLSSSERFQLQLNTGVYAPLRAAYRRNFFAWHEHAPSLFVDFPSAERPFPVPPELTA